MAEDRGRESAVADAVPQRVRRAYVRVFLIQLVSLALLAVLQLVFGGR